MEVMTWCLETVKVWVGKKQAQIQLEYDGMAVDSEVD